MNLTELIKWSTGIILGWAAIHHIDDIHRSILKAQAKLIYESRTETWGSPRFLSTEQSQTKVEQIQRVQLDLP